MALELGVTWFRFRATFKHRLTGYLSLVLLIALVGGVAMAALAGARRTESSFATYLASTNPSTVQLFTSYEAPQLGDSEGFRPKLNATIAHLGLVERSATAVIFDANINLDGVTGVHPDALAGEAPPTILGSFDGEFTSMDRLSVVAGRLFHSDRTDEAVVNVQAAQEMGVQVGSVISVPFYTDAQAESSSEGKPFLVKSIRIVGEVVASKDVIESDADALEAAAVVFSPALTQLLAYKCATGTETALQVTGGTTNVPLVLKEVYRVDPVAAQFPEMLTSGFVPAAEASIEPEAVALGVFGAIAGFTVLLIAGLVLARVLRYQAGETATLRAVGASRAMLLGDEIAGVLGAIIIGALLAVVVAVGLSPLTPFGPVRPVYPDRGLSFDWTVLGFGFLALTVVIGLLAGALASRETRRVATGRSMDYWRRQPGSMNSAVQALPVSVATGLQFALESGRGRNAAPLRSAILGSVLAVVVLVGTLTFGASLDRLVSHPASYGWNWNYAMLAGFAGQEDLPAHQTAVLLDQDHYVQAWSGVNFTKAALDGQRMPMLAQTPGASVTPPVLSGHGLEAADQIVLGQTTLASLHRKIGETVTFDDGVTKRSLLIVGTATMPEITDAAGGMGTGAIVSTSNFSAAMLNLQGNSIPGPNAILVRTLSSVNPSAAYRSLEAIDNKINAIPNDGGAAGGVVAVLRPIEIVNFRSMDATPAILAAGLAIGAVVALGLTISASVRRRRRELALLKSLGFTQRQVASVIAWQATLAALVGAVIGIPCGIILGRQLWVLFANRIDAVPAPAVPVLAITLVGVGALVLANAAAAFPGRSAARTPTALVLRAE